MQNDPTAGKLHFYCKHTRTFHDTIVTPKTYDKVKTEINNKYNIDI